MTTKKTPADAEASASIETPIPLGYVVRCHRERGIWRAGRFWPPENVPVRADALTAEQLAALQAEPLLSVQIAEE